MCSHSISRQADGVRQELHERSGGAESLKHQIPKIVAGHFLIIARGQVGFMWTFAQSAKAVNPPGTKALAAAVRFSCSGPK